MSVIRSRLTEEDLKQLLNLLGKVRLHLLYKASVHGFSMESFLGKCSRQGPTLTVGYAKSGFIFGAYVSKDFEGCENVMDDKAFLFRQTKLMRNPYFAKFPVKPDDKAFSCSLMKGFTFGESFQFINGDEANVLIMSGHSYQFGDKDPFSPYKKVDLGECEIYRVEELKAPLRKMDWSSNRRYQMINFIKKHSPFKNDTTRPMILLVGPLGAGKSSFINSTDSIFRDYVSTRTWSGNTTTKFAKYSFNASGQLPRLIICDTMGLAEDTGLGISNEDIINIIHGYIPNQYQFNTGSPIRVDGKTSTDTASPIRVDGKTSTGLTVHCIAYLIDASQTPILSSNMVKKIRDIQSQVNNLGVSQIVLLTQVDKACLLVAEDLENVYRSEIITKKMMDIGEQLGVPINSIFPVKNYWLSHELDCATDILILSALVQMLHSVDIYLENKDNLSL